MGAYVNYEFKKGFLLDEEKLRKLNDLIIKRICQFEQYKIIYILYREDAFYYETEDINVILNEENLKGQRIVKLVICVSDTTDVQGEKNNDSQFNLELVFDKDKLTQLSIRGNDRDFVFLLYSDLKDYINNNISIINSFDTVKHILATALVILIALLFVYFWDIYDELLYSINISYITAVTVPIVYLSSMWILSQNKLGNVAVPRNIFLLGREIKYYEKVLKTRSNILWGIIIATFVGIVSGLLVWLITG